MKSTKLLTFVFIMCGSVAAQVGGAKAPSAESTESTQVSSSNLGFEPVGPGDLIYISVTGSPELSRSSRVTQDGKLMLPLLSSGVPVEGLTPAKIAQAVSQALVKEKVLVDPIVSTEVLDYRSRRISVVGAVRMPGNYQAVGEMRLLDALARAQGLMPDAGPEVIVSGEGEVAATPRFAYRSKRCLQERIPR